MYGDSEIERFFGRTVREFCDDPEKGVSITFTDGTQAVAIPVGDCCALTTIVEVAGYVPSYDDFRLESVRKEDLGSIDTGSDTVDVFGTILTFTSDDWGNRDVLILCTCKHNGYYGGWVEWEERHVVVKGEVES